MKKGQARHLRRQIDEVIGGIVRKERDQARLSQMDLCATLGIDQSALSRIESGKQQLTASQWVLFCEVVHLEDYLAREVFDSLAQEKEGSC